eukprot:Gregarina_sp_Pseudo_9__5430@NODE_675_length_2390_cov_3_361123_g638_i0_p4_GENE_NODE_675_length_2390_cov_3_361123_g638_i0NODE_675_length_2390_cov_3_361123_g638_i0_p4_ORF_typecomplete_len163_score42_77REV/PF00424_18/0_022REV/PF00424_18/1_6e03_NODE_675_length_2390_cov_3_361123_g638_i0111599
MSDFNAENFLLQVGEEVAGGEGGVGVPEETRRGKERRRRRRRDAQRQPPPLAETGAHDLIEFQVDLVHRGRHGHEARVAEHGQLALARLRLALRHTGRLLAQQSPLFAQPLADVGELHGDAVSALGETLQLLRSDGAAQQVKNLRQAFRRHSVVDLHKNVQL